MFRDLRCGVSRCLAMTKRANSSFSKLEKKLSKPVRKKTE